jgi:hypothetical protein
VVSFTVDGLRNYSRLVRGVEGHRGTVEANVYQKTVDYPDEWANGYHVMLDTEELMTVRWDQVEGI